MTIKCRCDHGDGILTTDHAASSYGIPVVVVDGIAYGPAEVESVDTGTLHDPDAGDLVTRARDAGYAVYC